jgi:hypothetical protein
MSQIENGALSVRFKVPVDKIIYPPMVDLRGRPLS